MKDSPTALFRLLANAADGAFVVAENQRIVFWNSAAQEQLGYSAAAVLGRTCGDLLRGQNEPGDPFCRPLCPVIAAIRSGEAVANFDLRVHCRSGTERWVNVSTLVWTDGADGDAPLIAHLFRDATERKRAEALVDQVSHAVGHLNEPGAPRERRAIRTLPEDVHLTDRERQVLTLMARGLGTADIAASLTISTVTVRNHVQNILHKLRLHSRAQAVAYALEHPLAAE
jgi:PAS domain S-box-containing protein